MHDSSFAAQPFTKHPAAQEIILPAMQEGSDRRGMDRFPAEFPAGNGSIHCIACSNQLHGWVRQTLVGGLEYVLFFHTLGRIIPSD